MSTPPSPVPLPAPRFAPQKPSPLSQGHTLLTSEPDPSPSSTTANGKASTSSTARRKRPHLGHGHGGGEKRRREGTPVASSSGGAASAGGGGVVAAQGSNPGKQFATQVFKLVDALKQNNGPMNLSDLEAVTNVRGLLDEHTDVAFDRALYDAFNAHDRVVVQEKGKVKLFSYRPDYSISSPQDVLELLKRFQSKGGMSIAKLKESWPGVQSAIDELEAQGKVYVLRTGAGSFGSRGAVGGESSEAGEAKGGTAKMVMWNPMIDELEGKDGHVADLALDQEFQDMYRGLATPPSHALSAELASAGLVSSADSRPDSSTSGLNGSASGVRRKRGAKKGSGPRKVKITNTHLGREMGVDLSRDYVPGGGQQQGGSKGKSRS